FVDRLRHQRSPINSLIPVEPLIFCTTYLPLFIRKMYRRDASRYNFDLITRFGQYIGRLVLGFLCTRKRILGKSLITGINSQILSYMSSNLNIFSADRFVKTTAFAKLRSLMMTALVKLLKISIPVHFLNLIIANTFIPELVQDSSERALPEEAVTHTTFLLVAGVDHCSGNSLHFPARKKGIRLPYRTRNTQERFCDVDLSSGGPIERRNGGSAEIEFAQFNGNLGNAIQSFEKGRIPVGISAELGRVLGRIVPGGHGVHQIGQGMNGGGNVRDGIECIVSSSGQTVEESINLLEERGNFRLGKKVVVMINGGGIIIIWMLFRIRFSIIGGIGSAARIGEKWRRRRRRGILGRKKRGMGLVGACRTGGGGEGAGEEED
ncbi:hypothetical protein SDJN02_20314, partial [Cucurbita argyrosperma subsp. argyrosperma]